jgi:hypothetical protein
MPETISGMTHMIAQATSSMLNLKLRCERSSDDTTRAGYEENNDARITADDDRNHARLRVGKFAKKYESKPLKRRTKTHKDTDNFLVTEVV